MFEKRRTISEGEGDLNFVIVQMWQRVYVNTNTRLLHGVYADMEINCESKKRQGYK